MNLYIYIYIYIYPLSDFALCSESAHVIEHNNNMKVSLYPDMTSVMNFRFDIWYIFNRNIYVILSDLPI